MQSTLISVTQDIIFQCILNTLKKLSKYTAKQVNLLVDVHSWFAQLPDEFTTPIEFTATGVAVSTCASIQPLDFLEEHPK